MAGWISLHRSIEKHWLYEEERKFSRFEAWIDLLLMVNHADNKTVIDGKLMLVKRGQRITSLRKLGERWSWSLTKVDSFLKMLEDDKMIFVKKDAKKTLITIANYDIYQNLNLEKRHRKDDEKTVKERRKDTEQTLKKTNNNDNKVNNSNNDNNVVVTNDDYAAIQDLYQNNIELTPSPLTLQKLGQDFDEYGSDIMRYAIEKSAMGSNRDYKFINYLLGDWRKNRLTTVEAIKQYEDKRQSKTSYGSNQQAEKTPEWLGKENQVEEVDEEEKRKLEEELENFWKE